MSWPVRAWCLHSSVQRGPGLCAAQALPRLGSGGPELGLVRLSRAPPLGVGPQELGGLPSLVQGPRPVPYLGPLSSHQLQLAPRWQVPDLRSPNLEPCHLLLAWLI